MSMHGHDVLVVLTPCDEDGMAREAFELKHNEAWFTESRQVLPKSLLSAAGTLRRRR